MYQTMTTQQAISELLADKSANWTHEGAAALVEFIEELEEAGEPVEFDRVALRCEWSEHASINEALGDYSLESLEELKNATAVVELENGGLLVQQF